MEIWDAYYKDGTKANKDLVRGKDIPKGLFHVVCDVLVRHTDGDYLLMQRDYSKPSHAGEFEATAGGSMLKGEEPLDCIKRELFEETGIKCDKFSLVSSFAFDDAQCIFYSFICTVDCDKDKITLQQGETIDYRWISEEDFLKYINSSHYSLRRKLRYIPYFRAMEYVE